MTTRIERDQQHRKQHLHRKPQPSSEQGSDRTTVESADQTRTPEAVRAAKIAQDQKAMRKPGHRATGVDWVRPTDLMARHSAVLAGRGIDFEVELARRTRQLSGQVTRAGGRGVGRVGKTLNERARRLPDVSEFGRGSRHQSWVSRSGIGLG
ncbi:hypothetical protein Q7C18_06800 [Nesterenkonia sp. CL21]|uniref:hypothetical protein n=1 Tax=Nesterenkonia sp. CL21 TaxID=3064894 RepID=UPI002879B048|nr:hypothetical protein [Nesterenkonia sp. CL21]MDS2172399.1 hypothetical protein [Nesterenkonia sp. CL21]